MIIALASPRVASSLEEGLEKIKRLLSEASGQGAEIVCFPEAYLPGLRGQDFEVPPFDQTQQERALHAVAQWARTYAVATVLGMERFTDAGRQIAAFVIDARGQIQGYQTKNQLDPTEDQFYVPGNTRRLFETKGIKFGVAICHEGWRYPETVRWAAVRGAKIVFHPHHTGSNQQGVCLAQWGAANGPYYEKAMMMRSIENTIYFASVNYALRFQESATSLIAPSGQCQAYLPYGQEGVLVQAINVEQATGLLATRYAPERYRESVCSVTAGEMALKWSDQSEAHRMKKAIQVKPLSGYRIWLKYVDGVEGEVDLSHLAGRGVFKVWTDRKIFENVHVDESGAIAWNEGIDLCPDALYLRLTGKAVDELFPKLKSAPIDA